MRKFLLTITLVLLGYHSFAELVFRDDFQGADTPWSIDLSGSTTASFSGLISSEYLYIASIAFSSSIDSIKVSRQVVVNPNTSYQLTWRGAINNNDSAFNAPIRIYAGGNEYFSSSLAFSGQWRWGEYTYDFDLTGITNPTTVTLEIQVGTSQDFVFDWIQLDGTPIASLDSDGDGLLDSVETGTGIFVNAQNTGTDAENPDSDGDGLTDGAEVNTHLTDPNDVDSDDDTISDAVEISNGSDPNDPNSPTTSNTNRFEFMHADGNVLYSSITWNQSIDLNAQGNREFNIRYYPESSSTASVEFQLNGEVITIDNQSPYHLGGDGGAWLPSKGTYIIRAIEKDSSQQVISSQDILFNLTDPLDHRIRKVRISSGQADDLIQLRMKKHAFPFGSMFKYEARDLPGFKETFLSNFNYSVHGNAGKWYSNQPDWWNQSPHRNNYTQPGNHRFDNANTTYDYLTSQNIPMRGHTFFWGMVNNSQQSASNQMWDPDWVEARVASNPSDGLYWIEQRARAVANHWKDKIEEWDFNNEMGHGDWYRDTFTDTGPYGLTITKRMADWALDENPDLKLYHNDYGILMDNTFANTFKNLIKTMKSEGVPVDGIGCQGHWNNQYPDRDTIQASLDTLDDFGVPIKVTEFDIGVENGDSIYNNDTAIEQLEADGLETALRTFFEHKAVEGVIFWGFQESQHWRPECALYYPDWTPSPQLLRYRSLVFNEWWTEADVITSTNGYVDVALFPGDYELTINGVTQSISIPSGYKQAILDISSSSISLNQDSEIKLSKPTHANKYAQFEPIEMQVNHINNGLNMERVDFYGDGQKLKSDYTAPYTAVWLDASMGAHEIWAHCYYVDGSEELTVTNSVEVKTNSSGQNLLSNGGFESNLTNWQSFGGNLEIESNIIRTGSNSAKASNRTAEWNGVRSSLDLRTILEDGINYTLSCYARVDTGDHSLKIIVKSTKDGIASYGQIANAACNSTEWTKIEGEVVYDDVNQFSELFFYVSGAPTNVVIYVDDVVLKAAPVNLLDTDSDGLQDSWEIYYFGSVDGNNCSTYDDHDSDGFDNLSEFRAGTNPSDLNSALKINEVAYENDPSVVSWSSASNKLYRVLKSTNLTSNDWQIVSEGIIGNNSEISYNLSTTNTAEFIKIEVDE